MNTFSSSDSGSEPLDDAALQKNTPEPTPHRLRKDGGVDRRQFNSTPDKSKIKKGEIRNPNGRGGKKLAAYTTPIDEIYFEETSRLVPGMGGQLVPLDRRVIQSRINRAAQGKDPQAEKDLLDRLDVAHSRAAIMAQALAADLAWVNNRRLEIVDEFYEAKQRGMAPLDILPHPAHVHVDGMELKILGPVCREQRAAWELLKLGVKACTRDLADYRNRVRTHPNDRSARAMLRSMEAQRRKLMRLVPAGWDWREEIWTLDAVPPELRDAFRRLKELENESR